MNRFLELAALSAGGLSLCLVGYAACAKVTGHGEDDVRDFGRWLAGARGASTGPERSAPPPAASAAPGPAPSSTLVQASLGVLSAWTLPSPYSSAELGALAQELTAKRDELEEHRRLVTRRAEVLEHDERALEERLRALEDLRTRLEGLREELTQRELELLERERAGSSAGALRWAEVAAVLETIEEPAAAARKLQEFEPPDAARILAAFADPDQASLILNAVAPERWMEYLAAYSAERAEPRPGRSTP